MYIIDDSNKANNKFNKYLLSRLDVIKNRIIEINKTLKYISLNDVIKNIVDPIIILEHRDEIVSVLPNSNKYFDIIDFYVSNNAASAPQVKDSINSIKELISNKIKNDDVNLLDEKNSLLEEKEKINSLLSDKLTFEELLEVLENSDLSNDEKLSIISSYAYETTKVKENTQEKESKNNDELVNKYLSIKKEVDALIAKYYYLIENKNPKELEYMNQIVKAMIETNSGKTNNTFVKESLILSIMELRSNKKIIEESIKNNEFDELNFYLEYLETTLNECKELDNQFVLEEATKSELEKPKNVFFFIDEKLNPTFDLSSLSERDINTLVNLVKELEQGVFDYKSGISHSKVLTDKSVKENIFVNKKGKMALSYILLPSERVVVINYNDINGIFKKTNSLMKGSDKAKFDEFVFKINSEDTEIFKKQDEFKERIPLLKKSEVIL